MLRFDHLAIDRDGGRLFVANLSNDSLDVVDLKVGKLIKQLPGQRKAQGVAFVPELNRIYQGNGTDGVCNIFDGRTFAKMHALQLPDADNVRYNSKTGLIYVGHAEASLTAFDARSFEVKATVKLPGPPEAFQIDAERKRLYVNCLRPATVVIVDLNNHTLVSQTRLKLADACYPMALDTQGQRIFVGCRKPPMVVVLDAATGAEIAGAAIPGDIDDLFFDAKRNRLYASCGEGVLAVLEQKADKFVVVERIPTAKLARTCLFDPIMDRLYVVFPGSDGGTLPVLKVYEPQP
jgi:hypothetical protein